MIEPTEKDLLYDALVFQSIGKHGDAVHTIQEYIQSKEPLSLSDLSTFLKINKTAIDVIRASLRTFRSVSTHKDIQPLLELFFEKSFCKLVNIVETGSAILNTNVLPRIEEPIGISCVQKILGDFYRYITEYAQGEDLLKALETADKAYKAADDIAKNVLPAASPLRLSIGLNYSILKYEGFKTREEAVDILLRTRDIHKTELEELSEANLGPALEVLKRIETTFTNWCIQPSL